MGDIFREELGKLPQFKVENIKGEYKLDQNEYFTTIPKRLRNHIFYLLKNRYKENRYPQPYDYFKKKEKIANFLNISPNNIAITNGADQGILATMMIAKEKVGLIVPTYPIYENDAIILNKKIKKYELSYKDNFIIDKQKIPINMDLACLVSPNSPTGNLIDKDLIEYAVRNNHLVSLDEAYSDFSQISYEEMIKKYENLIIIKTFSKVGLAGFRFGYVLSSSKLIELIESVLFVPYNISLLHFALMDNFNELYVLARERGLIIKQYGEELYKILKDNNFIVYKSYGNFILLQSSYKKYKILLSNGIKTRFYRIENKDFIRITLEPTIKIAKLLSILKA